MDSALRKAYHLLADAYLQRKQHPWRAFVEFYRPVHSGICLDVGAGNGRNTTCSMASLPIAIDLSLDLLYGAPTNLQRVAGALPSLPIRKAAADEVLSIAVIHHGASASARTAMVAELHRVMTLDGKLIISVWRKWRQDNREKLLAAMQQSQDPTGLVDVNHPWKHQDGSVVAYRFYHLFTYKELVLLADTADLTIRRHACLGGRNGDANFFIELESLIAPQQNLFKS